MGDFPSIKGRAMLRILRRRPMQYRQKPGKPVKGSHRHLVSPNGYPDIAFWCHDKDTLKGSVVREILVDQVGFLKAKRVIWSRGFAMKTVNVMYRQEADGAWIATSRDVPGFVGHGDSYDETRDRVQKGLPWFAEEDLVIAHIVPQRDDDGTLTNGAKVTMTQARTTQPAPRYVAVPL